MNRRRFTTAALLAVSLLSAGCDPAADDKSGGPAQPRVLVMASNDGESLIGAPAVARFVDRVREVSGGRLTVRVVPSWQGGGSEARVIRDVAAGKADLGWSGTRAFDTVGVTAFQPLHAPFLVNSYAAQAAVVEDGVARDMLSGLDAKGLTGLALAADQLRMPAAAARPLLTPADFRGLRFGTVASTIQVQGLRALGAEPVTIAFLGPPDTDGLGALETMWWTYQDKAQHEWVPFVTANVMLWPRTVAVFANTDRLGRLDATTRDWVARAAADASTWSAVHASDQVSRQIQQVCGQGVRIATATPAQVDALRAAAEPVYVSLRADPALAKTLTRIETLVRSAGQAVTAPVPAACTHHPGDEARIAQPGRTLTGPAASGDLPPGSYRYAFSVDELLARGLDQHDAENNAGVTTWTLQAGRWHYVWKPAISGLNRPGAYTTCEGWYDVQGNTAWFTTTTKYDGGGCAPPTWSARWTAQGRTLSWTAVSVADFAYVWASKPWQRIS
ncbi:TRAP transporter substrate-binding protein [Kribbella sp. VKM Ac-2568]|uniref:TRAP transporter substrate-binding protein n=1 Tax=Kribbella sp. VKM Ac-2568 TaxID=2512219 RepID=UPI00104ED267|nr:TRAP transporter substrate-binding protein DctP [Kribbella sp. VKM Ac-2568]TCM42784.1 TRAP-type C4-dicarboxylate transport system substrate-binding protein [Kribbella sp. VKM Ac-2568]